MKGLRRVTKTKCERNFYFIYLSKFYSLFIFLDCDIVYTASSSYITHGRYPSRYLPNRDCKYSINAPSNKQILLNFDFFELERSTNCRNDYILITEGTEGDETSLGRYCGRRRPNTLRTTSGVLNIYFRYRCKKMLLRAINFMVNI